MPIVFSGQPADRLVGRESFALADVGYAQTEFFLEGTATAYAPAPGSTLTSDGRWTVEPSSEAAYKTRVVVNRPVDRRDFNGTVVVEWLNVSGGADASPDWMHTHVELIRRGYAWVGVSAQAVGINGLKAGPPQGDAVRYASLSHPGDSYSYDMFSQAGQAIRDEAATLLGGLRPRRLLAVDESQSAGRRSAVAEWFDTMRHPTSQPNPGFTCGSPINTGPQTFVLRSALAHLDRWVAHGTPPPEAPRYETVSISPIQYALDANGNVRGGIRTPAVDAPVATLSGLGQTGTTFCFLFGTTVPLTEAQLTALYGDHGGFVRALDPSHADVGPRRLPPPRGRPQPPRHRRPGRHPLNHPVVLAAGRTE